MAIKAVRETEDVPILGSVQGKAKVSIAKVPGAKLAKEPSIDDLNYSSILDDLEKDILIQAEKNKKERIAVKADLLKQLASIMGDKK